MNDPTWPSAKLVQVTKSNTVVYSPNLRQLYVGTTGNVVVKDAEGTTITFSNVPAGSCLAPFFIQQVLETTTASDIVGFY